MEFDHNDFKKKWWQFGKRRPKIDLGENHDKSHTTLEPYVEIDGVQVHVDKVEEYLKKRNSG